MTDKSLLQNSRIFNKTYASQGSTTEGFTYSASIAGSRTIQADGSPVSSGLSTTIPNFIDCIFIKDSRKVGNSQPSKFKNLIETPEKSSGQLSREFEIAPETPKAETDAENIQMIN